MPIRVEPKVYIEAVLSHVEAARSVQ